MRDAFRECQAYTRQHARSFYFASHVLPREKRLASYAVYAFCREADNIVDVNASTAGRDVTLRRLDDLRRELGHLYDGSGPPASRLASLQKTVSRYAIPREYFLDVIRGVEMDLTKARYASFEELKEYCYCVASVVGLIMTKIFGVSDDAAYGRAVDLGTAMQLTNILRDVASDAARDRLYLPLEDLARFGVPEQVLLAAAHDPAADRPAGLRELLTFEAERARSHYAAAARLVPS